MLKIDMNLLKNISNLKTEGILKPVVTMLYTAFPRFI